MYRVFEALDELSAIVEEARGVPSFAVRIRPACGAIGAHATGAVHVCGEEANVIRGEAALADGRLAGAALDVFENEPHVPLALRQLPNTVLTPHVASATHETRTHMADLVLANLDAHLSGQPLPATPF